MTENSCNSQSDLSNVVPDVLPALCRATPPIVLPIRSRWLPFAIVALWFAPKRIGPRMTLSPMRAVILMSALCSWLGVGLVSYEVLTHYAPRYGMPGLSFAVEPPGSEMTMTEAMRAPFASLTVIVHTLVPFAMGSPASLAIAALVLLFPLLLAVGLMPIVAAGESLGSLFRRCVQLSLLSLTFSVPFGTAWLLLPEVLHAAGLESPPALGFDTSGITAYEPETLTTEAKAAVALGIVFGVWWLIILVRSGLIYAGPAEGPGWEPLTPRCMKCGYVLARLSNSSTCPECATSIQASLDDASRRNKFTHWNAFKLALRSATKKAGAT